MRLSLLHQSTSKYPPNKQTSSLLPQDFFDVVVEGRFLSPAGGKEGLANDLLYVESDGMLGAALFVTLLATYSLLMRNPCFSMNFNVSMLVLRSYTFSDSGNSS